MERKLISTGSEWEKVVGYSRAVRVGNIIEVAGTVAVDEKGEIVGKGDPYKQTKFILEKIGKALKDAGGSVQDVVRTKIYTTDISKQVEISKAHGEMFSDIRPACTMVEVSNLIKKEFLVEVEVTAIVSAENEMKGSSSSVIVC